MPAYPLMFINCNSLHPRILIYMHCCDLVRVASSSQVDIGLFNIVVSLCANLRNLLSIWDGHCYSSLSFNTPFVLLIPHNVPLLVLYFLFDSIRALLVAVTVSVIAPLGFILLGYTTLYFFSSIA